RYTTDDGASWKDIDINTLVSMNMWGLQPDIFAELEISMEHFFKEEMDKNPLKSECFIPIEIGRMVSEKKASVKVLSSEDKWFGVTYKEDKPFVMESIQRLKDQGVYPEKLWV
ncbi:MAG: nucleotidyltransferase, partial [Lachnospiraceae bacterium]|nr:nucleotidyltransferase [Lachnospiraceae bacterium]